jgi:hypothetical protein
VSIVDFDRRQADMAARAEQLRQERAAADLEREAARQQADRDR